MNKTKGAWGDWENKLPLDAFADDCSKLAS